MHRVSLSFIRRMVATFCLRLGYILAFIGEMLAKRCGTLTCFLVESCQRQLFHTFIQRELKFIKPVRENII